MANFRIIYNASSSKSQEEVEASRFTDNPPWIDFRRSVGGATEQVLRVRADEVERIERVE